MIRRLGRLCSAIATGSALLACSAASAQAVEFHAESGLSIPITGAYPTKAENPSGEEAITFSFGATDVWCLTATFSGTLPSPTASTMTLSPALNRCLATSVTMGACDLAISATGKLAVTGGVECSNKPIEIRSGCLYKIGPQENLSTVGYANGGIGTTRDVTATFAVSGITYVRTGSGCGNLTWVNGELTGITTLRADNGEGKQQGLWVE